MIGGPFATPPAASFFKYTSAATAKLILERQSVRYSAPAVLNDPNDCQLDLDLPFGARELEEAATARFVAAVKSPTPIPHVRLTPFVQLLELARQNRLMAGRTDAEIAAFIKPALQQGYSNLDAAKEGYKKGIRDKWSSHLKVFCVSEAPDISLMWTHYATEHRGIVIELGFPDDIDNLLRLAKPVHYREAPPVLATLDEFLDVHFLGKPFDPEIIWQKLFYSKDAQYAYEREWRVTMPGEAYGKDYALVHLHPTEIRSVIFGTRCAVDDRNSIESLVRKKYVHASLLQAQLVGYSINFIPL